jgi:hypothetical protein
MTTSLRDLGERAGRVPAPQLDVVALVAAGESRLRRRRAVAVAAVSAVVVAVLSAAQLLAPGSQRAAPPPAGDDRTRTTDDDVVETRPAARQLTYSVGTVIHWGDRTIDVREQAPVRKGLGLGYLDATDDGVVFATGPKMHDRGVAYDQPIPLWFTDGSTPVRIGTTSGSGVRGYAISASTSGSTLAWREDFYDGVIVVYDTAHMREVARLGDEHSYVLNEVYDDVVYWAPDGASCTLTNSGIGPVTWCPPSTPVMRFDVASGRQSRVSWADYEADRRRRPGLFTGPNRRPAGCISCVVNRDGLYPSIMLVPRGGRLVLGGDYGLDVRAIPGSTPTVALTGRPVHLRVPARYLDSEEWRTSQWLDADRVVLAGHGLHSYGGPALFDCRLSTGECRYVVTLPDNVNTVAGETGGRG